MSYVNRAVCPVCGRPYKVTASGTIRKHWKRDGMGKGLPFSDPCDGSGAEATDFLLTGDDGDDNDISAER